MPAELTHILSHVDYGGGPMLLILIVYQKPFDQHELVLEHLGVVQGLELLGVVQVLELLGVVQVLELLGIVQVLVILGIVQGHELFGVVPL